MWCGRLDAVLEQPKAKKTLAKYFVMVRLTVNEAPLKKNLENAGAADLLSKLGGAGAGLPFFAILGPDGKKLGDSLIMPKQQNVGFPGTTSEIAAFEALLKKTAPKMTAADLATITGAFRDASK